MRICILTHNLKSDNGTGVFSLRLLRDFEKELGAQVVAVTTEGNGFTNEKPILKLTAFTFLGVLLRVRNIVKQCDVVHAMDTYPYGIIATLAALGLKKKIIITAIGTGSIQPLRYARWPIVSLMKWSYRRAAAVTAISRFTRDLILQSLPGLTISVINPGIDYEKFSSSSTSAQDDMKISVEDSMGKRHVLGDLRPYILSVGLLRWRKGYKRSIKAFARVLEKFPDLRYIIVGRRYSEKYYEELLRIIKEYHLESSVIFLDKVDDFDTLRALYRNAELFCLLSQHFGYDVEGFGMVFLEAAAVGLPVVGSTESGIEDAVNVGENGLLVDWRDEKGELAKAIITILSDTHLRVGMSRASLAWVKESSWEKRIAEYVALYKNVLG